jgi:cytidylate kinase
VGPGLAKRMRVPFVDRAIPTAVSARLDVPLDEALAHEEQPEGAVSRRVAQFAPLVQMLAGAPLFPDVFEDDESFLAATQEVLRESAATGAVILGRGAAVVLRDDPHVLHVRLDGPPERRVLQGMRLGRIDRAAAEEQLRSADLSRESYVRHWYNVDARDPDLYHLVIDSTAIELEACIELIALASASRTSPSEDKAPPVRAVTPEGP